MAVTSFSPPRPSARAVPLADRLMVALDLPDIDQAKAMVESLGPAVTVYKVGLELFMTGQAFDLMDWLDARGKKVFADLKFFDVPQTVASAVRGLRDRPASFVTVHGNQAIMEAAAAEKGGLTVLGVTVLTSLDQGDLEDLGFQVDVRQVVLSRARRALEAGLDGVVSSGLEAEALRDHLGDRLLVVVPGIRPVANRGQDDQKRTVDVEDAFRLGADHIVVGRPIRQAPDPRAMAEAIQGRIAAVFSSDTALR